jgi:hypothetical protein
MAAVDPELDVAVSAMVTEDVRFVPVGGLAPLDYETVEQRAMRAEYGDVEFPVAALSSIVGFKRLADRPRGRNDLLGSKKSTASSPSSRFLGSTAEASTLGALPRKPATVHAAGRATPNASTAE